MSQITLVETATVSLSEMEFTIFEKFVDVTDSAWWLLENNPSIAASFSAIIILLVCLVFHYHESILRNYEFYEKNISIAGRFCKPTFDGWRMVAITIIPIGIAILVFSCVTKFKSEPFLAIFGIKGVSKIKDGLIRKSVKESRRKT